MAFCTAFPGSTTLPASEAGPSHSLWSDRKNTGCEKVRLPCPLQFHGAPTQKR